MENGLKSKLYTMNDFINNKKVSSNVAAKYFTSKPQMDFSSLFKLSRSLNVMANFLDAPNNIDSPQSYKRLSIQACTILNDLRSNNQLCDSIIKVDDGTEFPIHRAVLSATSNYFHALFTNGMNDTNNKTVLIHNIDSNIMRSIIEYAYTRDVIVDCFNVEKLLPAADQFQTIGLLTKCIEFLDKNIDCDNVIGIKRFADNHFCTSLSQVALKYLMFNFVEIAKTSVELLETSFEEFVQIIRADELNISEEKILFQTIIKWIDFNPSQRKKFILELIECLRLKYLPKKYFMEKVKTHPYIDRNDKNYQAFLGKCLCFYNIMPFSENSNLSDIKIRPRIPHEMLISIGGWYGKFPTNLIEIYDPRADVWQNFTLVDKSPRAYHGCITIGGFVYVIGGYDGRQFFNNCKRIDLVKREWQEIAPMYIKRCYVTVTCCNGLIYAIGGFDGLSRQASAERYNHQTNQWSQIADMNFARSDASAAELNGRVYVCGGFNGSEPMETAEMYDPTTNEWTMITPMLNKRSGLGMVNFNDNLYVIGGFDGTNRLKNGEKYDFVNKCWNFIPEMFSPRSNFGIAVCDGYILAMGGYNGSITIKNVECYNEELKEWRIKEKMNLDRSALSAAVIKGIDFVRPFSALENYTCVNEKMNGSFLRSILGYYDKI